METLPTSLMQMSGKYHFIFFRIFVFSWEINTYLNTKIFNIKMKNSFLKSKRRNENDKISIPNKFFVI